MKLSVSNISLPPYNHASMFHLLNEMGVQGIEVAPSRVWHDTWHNLSANQVTTYRSYIEKSGLSVVGLHSLLYDHPELGLFDGIEKRKKTIDYLVHLSAVCRDLGGYTLILGGGRRRGRTSLTDAFNQSIDFLGEYCNRVDGHNTVLCLEPLGPSDSDFVNSVYDSIRIVKEVNNTSLGVQLDAKALVENKESGLKVFEDSKDYIVHFHANEPKLGVLGSSGLVPHKLFGSYLRQIKYSGFVSIEQRMISAASCIDDIKLSVNLMKENYI